MRRKLRRKWVRVRRKLGLVGSGPVFVFHHIPKTGGVSIRTALSDWFVSVPDYRPRVNKNDFWSERMERPPADLASLRRYDCLTGHWENKGFYLEERYPAVFHSDRFRVFTFVRHPLQIQLSLYSWEQKKGKKLGAHELEQELLARPNFLANRIPCASVAAVPSTLGQYDFVGLTEDLQGSFDQLAVKFGMPKAPVPHRNRSRSSSSTPDFSESFLEKFKEANSIDYAIYEYARATLEGVSP